MTEEKKERENSAQGSSVYSPRATLPGLQSGCSRPRFQHFKSGSWINLCFSSRRPPCHASICASSPRRFCRKHPLPHPPRFFARFSPTRSWREKCLSYLQMFQLIYVFVKMHKRLTSASVILLGCYNLVWIKVAEGDCVFKKSLNPRLESEFKVIKNLFSFIVSWTLSGKQRKIRLSVKWGSGKGTIAAWQFINDVAGQSRPLFTGQISHFTVFVSFFSHHVFFFFISSVFH